MELLSRADGAAIMLMELLSGLKKLRVVDNERSRGVLIAAEPQKAADPAITD